MLPEKNIANALRKVIRPKGISGAATVNLGYLRILT